MASEALRLRANRTDSVTGPQVTSTVPEGADTVSSRIGYHGRATTFPAVPVSSGCGGVVGTADSSGPQIERHILPVNSGIVVIPNIVSKIFSGKHGADTDADRYGYAAQVMVDTAAPVTSGGSVSSGLGRDGSIPAAGRYSVVNTRSFTCNEMTSDKTAVPPGAGSADNCVPAVVSTMHHSEVSAGTVNSVLERTADKMLGYQQARDDVLRPAVLVNSSRLRTSVPQHAGDRRQEDESTTGRVNSHLLGTSARPSSHMGIHACTLARFPRDSQEMRTTRMLESTHSAFCLPIELDGDAELEAAGIAVDREHQSQSILLPTNIDMDTAPTANAATKVAMAPLGALCPDWSILGEATPLHPSQQPSFEIIYDEGMDTGAGNVSIHSEHRVTSHAANDDGSSRCLPSIAEHPVPHETDAHVQAPAN